jgi:tRNA(Ile)-lysidine synthase
LRPNKRIRGEQLARCYNPFVYDKVAQTIEQYSLISPGAAVVLGISGGADSLCLLDCLVQLNYQVVVAHLDHQLRPESGDEVEFVREVSTHYDVPFISEAVIVREHSESGGSLEELARLARYNFLVRVLEDRGAECVAVGHTADDQVETILMHLLRGSGPAGLRGMLPKTSFTEWIGIKAEHPLDLIRPLIELTRAETAAHCESLGLQPLEDPSNLDLSFYRNRIRHELLPMLESYNPGIRKILLRLSEVMREQVEFNQAQLEATWSQVITEISPGGFRIDTGAFTTLHPFLQRAVVRRAIKRLAPTLRDISHEATLRAVTWLQEGGPVRALALPGKLSLETYGEQALLRRVGDRVALEGYPQVSPEVKGHITCPGEIMLERGWRISARFVLNNEESRKRWYADPHHWIAVFDADNFPERLIVRARMPGDRIQLPGVSGTTKIADLMINHKVPRQARAGWPLVLIEGHVLWLPGIQRSDRWLLADSTTNVIVLQLRPPDEMSHLQTRNNPWIEK